MQSYRAHELSTITFWPPNEKATQYKNCSHLQMTDGVVQFLAEDGRAVGIVGGIIQIQQQEATPREAQEPQEPADIVVPTPDQARILSMSANRKGLRR